MGEKVTGVHTEFALLTEVDESEQQRSEEEIARLKDQVICLQVWACHPCARLLGWGRYPCETVATGESACSPTATQTRLPALYTTTKP